MAQQWAAADDWAALLASFVIACTGYRVTIHVQANPTMSLEDAYALGERVKAELRGANAHVQSVLVHMEPYRG